MNKETFELIMIGSVMLITAIAIIGGSIYRKDGKWKCLLLEKRSLETEKQ